MDTGQELHLRHQSNLQSVRPLISCDLVSHRAGVPGRPVLCAVPPGHLTLSVAPLASPTADSSHLRSSTPALSLSPKQLPTTRAVITDDLDLLHVPPTDFKIRCATHLSASSVRTPAWLTAGLTRFAFSGL